MTKFFKKIIFVFDPIFALLAILGSLALIAKRACVASFNNMALTRFVFKKINYLPVQGHYYEPLSLNKKGGHLRPNISRLLFEDKKDFEFLQSIQRPQEFIESYSKGNLKSLGFQFENGSFESGDAEVLYYFIRSFNPSRVIEIGGGHSSKIINAALLSNKSEGSNNEHIIIEPYENPWLDSLSSRIVREPVQELDLTFFSQLTENDVLFIDSSHVISSQNDCVFEYTEILPILNSGVIIHVHDIFSPFEYPNEWIEEKYFNWAEQYLLESILLNSDKFQILAPLNWLSKDTKKFSKICPYFKESRNPGSFWIKKL